MISVRSAARPRPRSPVPLACALVDGQPVTTGGCTLTGEVAQLWGGMTLPASRGRGSYRAVLADYGEERCYWLPVS
jgi:hypothetical protein